MNLGDFPKFNEAQRLWNLNLIPIVSVLPKSISEGTIQKYLFFRNENAERDKLEELALLLMEPGSRILLHQHLTNSEVYIYEGKEEKCEPGGWHSLTNDKDYVLVVVSVKTKA